jgi:hypothetical protein
MTVGRPAAIIGLSIFVKFMLQDYFKQLSGANRAFGSLLMPEVVLERSKLFAYHPIISTLGAYILDDENTSNHHCLVTKEPLAGTVFFLSHDGDSRVVFADTMSFMQAVSDAAIQGVSVSDLHPALSPIAANQTSLSQFLRSVFERGDCNELVVSLIPSLDLKDIALLQEFANDSDFYLGEAVAMEIEKRPAPFLLAVAASCAENCHPQVASAGARAVRRVGQLS